MTWDLMFSEDTVVRTKVLKTASQDFQYFWSYSIKITGGPFGPLRSRVNSGHQFHSNVSVFLHEIPSRLLPSPSSFNLRIIQKRVCFLYSPAGATSLTFIDCKAKKDFAGRRAPLRITSFFPVAVSSTSSDTWGPIWVVEGYISSSKCFAW